MRFRRVVIAVAVIGVAAITTIALVLAVTRSDTDSASDYSDLVETTAIAPDEAKALNALIDAAQKQREEGRVAEAEATYLQILESQPLNVIANYNLGQLLSNRNEFGLAAQRYATVLSVRPERHDVRFFYVIALAQHGDDEEAIDELNIAVATYPLVPEYSMLLGQLLVLRGDIEDGEMLKSEAIKRKPSLQNWNLLVPLNQ